MNRQIIPVTDETEICVAAGLVVRKEACRLIIEYPQTTPTVEQDRIRGIVVPIDDEERSAGHLRAA